MAKRDVKAKSATGQAGGTLPAMAGFAATVLPMAGLLVALWMAPLPVPRSLDEATPVEHAEAGRETGVIYVDLTEPLTVATAPDLPRVQLTVAVAIKGSLLDLAAMEQDVLAKEQHIMAELLAEAQAMVAEGADSDRLHRDLPERLRRVINRAVGTEDWPEPVVEVLITSMAMQG